MELNFKLTYNIPKELIKALNITNDTRGYSLRTIPFFLNAIRASP